MKTSVINIKYAPKGWIDNRDYVYIGRSGHGLDGYFGNPIQRSGGVGSTLKKYEQFLRDTLSHDPDYRGRVKDLYGKTLVCFCKPKPCHGDILIKYVELLNGRAV